ncbi:hypothetical protein IG193_04135 [Infirmifilum lucidum]|uniref:Uncharacterized protein n=1 Tax=Infirmifilum lucidum TaxID=2776706 RepID=A0A7L9FJ26_9CREN|nr:hypothetical protein [Infirmifilum lucidum]QOJ79651.1 hypothetical protein IG193_04135 [Infirmifilum lucidum]
MLEWAIGASLTLIAFLYKWFTLHRKEALRLLSRELAETLFLASLILVLQGTYSVQGAGLHETTARLLEDSLGVLRELLDMIIKLSKAIAVLDITLGIVFAGAGGGEALAILSSYQTLFHASLGPLEALAGFVGTGIVVARALLVIVRESRALSMLVPILAPLLLVPRLRKLALPLWLFSLALGIALPIAVQSYTTDLHVMNINVPDIQGMGLVKLRVVEASGTPIFKPDVLVAFRDSEGSLYVARVREGSTLALPVGNYTAAWVVHYWTNFTIPACCLSPSNYSSCNCYVWPARLEVSSNSTLEVLVWLPVDLIDQGVGHSGHVIAYAGDTPLHPVKGEGYVSYSFSHNKLRRGVTVAVRGGEYSLSNPGKCSLNVTIDYVRPPGKTVNFQWLSEARRSYTEWLNRVIRGVTLQQLIPLHLSPLHAPGYREYSIHLRLIECNATGEEEVSLTIRGHGEWNASTAPAFIERWQPVTALTSLLIGKTLEYVNPITQLMGAILALFFTSAALLGLSGVNIPLIKGFIKSLLPRPRTALKIPLFNTLYTTVGKKIIARSHPLSVTGLEGPPWPISKIQQPLEQVKEAKKRRPGIAHTLLSRGLRAFEGPLRVKLKNEALEAPHRLHKAIYTLLGYKSFEGRQLWFYAVDGFLEAHMKWIYERLLSEYKELAINDLRDHGTKPDVTSRYSDLILKARSLEEVDTLLFEAMLFDFPCESAILKKYKIYQGSLLEPVWKRVLLNYRLVVLEKLARECSAPDECREISLAHKLYRKPWRVVNIEKKMREGI